MAEKPEATPSTDDSLDAVIADYLQQVEAGAVPDREALLTRYPEMAERLRAFLADLDCLDGKIAELHLPTSSGSTVDLNGPAGEATRLRSFGDYALMERIARGGMGIVYKAYQLSLRRPVALKMILNGELATSQDIARFRHEARAAANLEHPNIVPIYEVGEYDGLQYYAMRFIVGTSLARRPRADARTEAALLSTVAAAVHYAHRHKILHLDLKPSNILLNAAGTPFVTDFGLAKRVDTDRSLTESGAVLGTPQYMAPEQVAGRKNLTVAADVYSLGVLLYDRLTGQTPFNDAPAFDVLRQVRDKQPPRPSSIKPGLDRDLETICLKCLEKQPDKRYESAEALSEDVERWLQGKPIKARPIGRIERGLRWAKQACWWVRLHPKLATALAGTLAVLVIALVLYQHANRKWAAEKHRADREHEDKVRRMYAARMFRAQRAWQDTDLKRVDYLLSFGSETPRGFEWFYLDRLRHLDLKTITQHDGAVTSVAFSPDGQRLATASDDSTVTILKADGSGPSRILHHHDRVSNIAFSPDGSRLASASWDGSWTIWDAKTAQQLLATIGHKAKVNTVAFSPDGRHLVTGSRDETVKVWDAVTGTELLMLRVPQGAGVNSVAFSPDGNRIAGASQDATVRIWNASTGEQTAFLRGHLAAVWGIAFSPDGTRLATASWDKTVKIWDVKKGFGGFAAARPVFDFRGHTGEVGPVAFSADGKRLATGSYDYTARIWNTETGVELVTIKGHTENVSGVAFNREGTRLATSSWDGSVRIWDPKEYQEVAIRKGPEKVVCVAFSPDSDRVASGLEDNTIAVWGTDQRSPLVRLLGHKDRINAVRFSQDGSYIASASDDKWIFVWDVRSGRRLASFKHDVAVRCVAFSWDGKSVASGCSDGTARLWNMETGKSIIATRQTMAVRAVAFSPKGANRSLLAVALEDNDIVLIELTSGKPHRISGHRNPVNCLAFSPDGNSIVSAARGREVFIWHLTEPEDFTKWEKMQALQWHGYSVTGATFSNDGRRVATCSSDRTAKVWDSDTGEEILTFKATSPFSGIAFSRDDKRLAGAAGDTVIVWDAHDRPQSAR